MADNILTNNGWYGIRLIDSRNNTISGNNQTHAHYGGIRLSSSSNNTISNNNITSNDDGVYVESSSNNIICHNNFVENSRQVRSTSSANSWDDGDTSGGNYWSDYSSTDIYSGPYQNETGSDGKGDTPYVIDANNRDRYPLMNPWIITPPTPPPKFRVGDQVRTTANLKVREGPGLGHTIVSIVPEGALGQILGGPVEADGYTWWDVDYDIGVRGWSAEDWLEEWFELNNPPFPPISLSQSKADASPLSIGGTTVESTVCLYGVVSDPDNDQVKLQVELRNLNEYSGEFNEAAGGFKESEPVSSGNEAVAFANELIDESYHWRARTIDEHGLASDWVDFGGNGILEPDFIVRAGAQSSNKIRLSNSLKELKEAIRFKLLYDVGIVAQIFTSVKDYWRAKRWADIASVGLETIKDAFSIGTIPARLYDIITNPDPEYQKAKGALELASLLLMAQGIKRTGENLVTGLYGPSYTNTIHDMLDGSDQIFFFNYDAAVYRAFIDTYLKIPPPDKQSPLTVPRKSGDINRKTVGLTDGMIDVYMSISKTIRCLIDDVGRFDLPDSFPIEPVISELEQLETGIMRSCFPDQMGGTKIDWDTYLKDGESYIPQHMSMTFGKPAQLLSVFGLCAGSLADKSTVEIVNTFIKAGGAVVDAIQVYRMAKTNEIITVKSSYLSDVGMILSGASISTQLVLNTYYSDTEKQFYELPQEMLLTLPTEFSNVWMMVDDIDRCIRHEIDISPGTPESEIGGIVAKLGSPGVLQVCDSEGRVTGIVNGLTAEEIPNSECFNNTVIILWPNDTYCYRVIGTELGFYGLRVDSVAGDDAVSFSAADIPITEDAVHLFSIDWAALSLGEEGVTVQVDLDRNGVFERSLTSDSELARDEYVAAVFTADIDGDKIANMKDVSIAVNAFNSFPTQPRWNPYADLDTNSRIDMRDIVAIVLNFNRRYP
jgi:parallel beta-helix repeat protein